MGVYHRVPVRVMEVTLKKAYDNFKTDFPDVKISRCGFERLRPKNIRLRRLSRLRHSGYNVAATHYSSKMVSKLHFLTVIP